MSTVSPAAMGATLEGRTVVTMASFTLCVLVIMLIPLPTPVLDMLLAFNVSMSILLLVVIFSVSRPLEFAVFPSLLLLLTLFRLALNVATTRLILMNGDAGEVVEAFGNYVVGGDLVVGIVIFLILVVIQFIVITRGAGRVSEVAARFKLDSLPGKQMAIDADLQRGAIDDAEATRRRHELARESDFYATMDGASKFVRGDTLAGLIITAINLFAGVLMGLSRGQPLAEAARTYCVLTIGDGLISQVPALIISTASGILVTKAASQASLGREITLQFLTNPGAMKISAVIVAGLGLAPGLPLLPFLGIAGVLYYAAGRTATSKEAEKGRAEDEAAAGTAREEPAPAARYAPPENFVESLVKTDRISLDVGGGLHPLVESTHGPGLAERITEMRRNLMYDSGLWAPSIPIHDNMNLPRDDYAILVNGIDVARWSVRPHHWLAVDPGTTQFPLSGEQVSEPAFGMSAVWIPETEKQRAMMAGYWVLSPIDVIIIHLTETIRRHAHELLGREDVKALVDGVRQTSPTLVDELIPKVVSMAALHRVLLMLLEERVSIANLTRILESLASHAPTTNDYSDLVELVRKDIGRSICSPFRNEQGHMRAVLFHPQIEMDFRRAVHDRMLVIDVGKLEKLIARLEAEQKRAQALDRPVALLCDESIRRPLRKALVRSLSTLTVIAYQEIPRDLLIETVAMIKPEELG